MKHVLEKVDKWHFSKNEFFVFFKLFTKNVLTEKKHVYFQLFFGNI